MKRLTLFCLLSLMMAVFACGPQNKIETPTEPFALEETAKEKLTQTVPSGSTAASSITFEASSPWTSSVNITRSDSWLIVTPDHGNAGVQTVSFTLLPNEGTESRSAIVTFTCEGGSFSVTIVQEGTASHGNPGEYVKHPAVDPNDRISHITYNDKYDDGSNICVLTYGEDGTLSNVKEYFLVKNGICEPDNVEETVFDRTASSSGFRMLRTEKIGKSIEAGADGMVQIGENYTSAPDRIASLYLYDIPVYTEREEGFVCKRTGTDLSISGDFEDFQSLVFSYDEDGNLLLAKNDTNDFSIKGVWDDDDLVSISCTYIEYYSYSDGRESYQEVEEKIDIRYSDRLNPFHGVSLNCLILEDVFDSGPFLDDDISGMQTKHLPVRLEYSSSSEPGKSQVTDISYTFDDVGRVVTMSLHTPGEEDTVYNVHYSAQSIPIITIREDPASSLVSQEITSVEYDPGHTANAICIRSHFADGHSTTDRLYPVENYPEKIYDPCLYTGDPDLDKNATCYWYNVTADQYSALGDVSVKQEKVDESETNNGRRVSILYSLDYGKTKFYTRFQWHTQSLFDYIAWWDGSEIKYVVCKHYMLQPEDALLQPSGNWYISDAVYSGKKMTSCTLTQPLSLVWPKLNNQPVFSEDASFNARIYLNFAGDGI